MRATRATLSILCLLVANIALAGALESPTTSAQVTAVVDGDTLKLSTGETVRLIGVDTPESVHPTKPVEYFAKEASAFTSHAALGKSVRLEYDKDPRDRYDRTLAYVYLPDGRMLNELIVKYGFGYAYTTYPFKYSARFVVLERNAAAHRLGLWAQPQRAKRPAHPADPPTATKFQRPVAPKVAQPRSSSTGPRHVGPPISASRVGGTDAVYIAPTGQKYHSSTCRTLNRTPRGELTALTRAQAEARGYDGCKVCGR